MTPTDTLIAAACITSTLIGLVVGWCIAFIQFAPKIADEEPEQYNVPDPRIIALNREIERKKKRHEKVSHLYAERKRICHEGLKA